MCWPLLCTWPLPLYLIFEACMTVMYLSHRSYWGMQVSCPQPGDVSSALLQCVTLLATAAVRDAPVATSNYSESNSAANRPGTDTQEPIDIGMHESSFLPLWTRIFSGIDEAHHSEPEKASDQWSEFKRHLSQAKSTEQHPESMQSMPCISEITHSSRWHEHAESSAATSSV